MLEGLCSRVAAAHVPIVCVYTRLFLPPECQLLVKSSKLSEPKMTKAHRSLPHKSLVNSTSVLLTYHPAPTSEFSAEEEEEVNNSSTSRGDLDSDPTAGLLSPVLIR
jgi:hypothetical protein